MSKRSDAKQAEAARPVALSDDEWRQKLSPERYAVLRKKGTGMFTCAGCGAELFSSDAKFESGSGWPSFFQGLGNGTIEEHDDSSFGMRRTEIVCANCGGHLGHVFPDGPAPTGLRYCVNSLSIDFEPTEGSPSGSAVDGD